MSGMTITEKILAAHADRDAVGAGEIVMCRVDLAMANDVTAPPAVRAFEKMGATCVWIGDPSWTRRLDQCSWDCEFTRGRD